jgi:hypothetical protein
MRKKQREAPSSIISLFPTFSNSSWASLDVVQSSPFLPADELKWQPHKILQNPIFCIE